MMCYYLNVHLQGQSVNVVQAWSYTTVTCIWYGGNILTLCSTFCFMELRPDSGSWPPLARLHNHLHWTNHTR